MNKEDMFRQFAGNKPEPGDDEHRLAQKQFEREKVLLTMLTEVVIPKIQSIQAEMGLVRAQLMERQELTMGDFEASEEEARLAEQAFLGKSSGD